ncbi:MAG: hypothetical protein K6E29_00195 [Cyanobacteria bacterium RUI128]|nr:hypothetical protein [Cyanobacteria bacterium RUI128]
MEFNNVNFFAQNAAALNKAQGKEEVKKEEVVQPEVKDNKPAEKQCSADDVFAFLAGSNVGFKVKVSKAEKADAAQEARIGNFMAEFEEAFDFAKSLGLSDEAAFAVIDRI